MVIGRPKGFESRGTRLRRRLRPHPIGQGRTRHVHGRDGQDSVGQTRGNSTGCAQYVRHAVYECVSSVNDNV